MALGASIKKDLQLRLADPLEFLLWMGIPLLLGGLMTLAFGGSDGVTPKAKMLVTNEDDSFLAKAVLGMAENAGGEFLDLEQVDAKEGKRRIDQGQGSGYLTIPKGFMQAVLADEPAELELVVNPSQRILPKILQGGLEMFSEAAFYLQKTFGDVVQEMLKDPPDGQNFFANVKVAALGAKVNSRLRSLENIVIPPVLVFEDELTEKQLAKKQKKQTTAPKFQFGMILLPGILFMSMLFMAQGMSYDVWREKDQGTLARLMCSPSGRGTFILAKTISATITMTFVAAAGLALGHFAFGLALTALPLALVWTAFSGACMFLLFLVIQMLASSSRGANVLTSSILFPLMMIGGSFFPFEALPKGLAAFGRWTPNGVAVTQLKSLLAEESELPSMLVATATLTVLGGIFFFLASRQLAGRFSRG